VIGSDGLWDMMTPMQVIRLVGEHMSGKVTLSPLVLDKPHIPLQEIASLLRQRQAAMKLKPTDENAATHLIRCALGGTAYGVDHSRLSQMLSLPPDMVRMFRDDITITVVFFDEEYLRHCWTRHYTHQCKTEHEALRINYCAFLVEMSQTWLPTSHFTLLYWWTDIIGCFKISSLEFSNIYFLVKQFKNITINLILIYL